MCGIDSSCKKITLVVNNKDEDLQQEAYLWLIINLKRLDPDLNTFSYLTESIKNLNKYHTRSRVEMITNGESWQEKNGSKHLFCEFAQHYRT